MICCQQLLYLPVVSFTSWWCPLCATHQRIRMPHLLFWRLGLLRWCYIPKLRVETIVNIYEPQNLILYARQFHIDNTAVTIRLILGWATQTGQYGCDTWKYDQSIVELPGESRLILLSSVSVIFMRSCPVLPWNRPDRLRLLYSSKR